MRIILVHKFFKLTGGADFFFFEVARVLKEKGHEVAFFSTQDVDNKESKYSEYFVKAPNFKSQNVVSKLSSIFKIVHNKQAKKEFERLINDFKPDLVHIFAIATHISPSILPIAKKYKLPVVASFNDYKHICPNYKLYHHGKICEDCKTGNYLYTIKNKCAHNSRLYSTASAIESYFHNKWGIYQKNIDIFLFASRFMAKKTEEFWQGKPFIWSRVLNPFDPNSYQFSYEHDEYGLYFGRIIDEKGVDRLIKAVEKSQIKKFIIVGEGPQEEELRSYVRNKSLKNIEFKGPLWGDKLSDILLRAKFVVVPSIWHENYPYVILQAFAAGKPVIGSNRGGIPEMIEHNKTGLIFDIDNHSKFVDALNIMQNLTNDESLLLGQNARKFIEKNFGDDNFYQSILNAYKKVV